MDVASLAAHAAFIRSSALCLLVLLLVFTFKLHRLTKSHVSHTTGQFKALKTFATFVFLSLAVYQGGWQLIGFMDSGFLRAQRGFDSRGDLLQGRFERGAIFDANSVLLAEDIKVGTKQFRHYPYGAAMVHILGYHHPVFGSTGLEREMDSALMGRKITHVKDLLRLSGNIFVRGSLSGYPVRLALIAEIQQLAVDLLKGKTGAAVVIAPFDGSVLAMASSPSFEPEKLNSVYFNQLSRRKDSPFLNRAIQGLYPPASTIKPLVAVCAIDHGVQRTFRCEPQGFYCGSADKPVRDHEFYKSGVNHRFEGHGDLDWGEALVKSCNVYYANLGALLTSDFILSAYRQAGLNESVQSAGDGLISSRGSLPQKMDQPLARTARLAIGQDMILTTPLHMALIAGALGSDGIIYKTKYLADQEKEIWKTITGPATARSVAEKMVEAVESGTGTAAKTEGVIVGGKTGTAQNETNLSHAWFVGFAPWPAPRIAFAIIIEQGGYGGINAAPIAQKIIAKASELGILTRPIPQEKNDKPHD